MPYYTVLSFDVDWKPNLPSEKPIQFNIFLTEKGIKVKKSIRRDLTISDKTRISFKVHQRKMKREKIKIKQTKRSEIILKKSKAIKKKDSHTNDEEEAMIKIMQRLSLKRRAASTEENTFKKIKM